MSQAFPSKKKYKLNHLKSFSQFPYFKNTGSKAQNKQIP